LRQLKRLQDCLGEYRDAAEALDWLSGLPDPLAPALLLALRQPIRRVMDRRRRELRKLSDDFEMPDLSMPA
jgi:CHAD domain-containing protein